MRKLSLPIAFALAGLSPFGAAAAADAADLPARLAEAERLAGWVPALAMLCGALILVVLALAWRLWRTPRPGNAQDTAAPSTSSLPASVELLPASDAELPPTGALLNANAPAEPTLEEHIDLDQQVDFLLVLGQDEEAVDLLLEHLRGTGGTSPGPYLRLMQIYRQRHDQGAYERTRERFNQRFNALAPQWPAERASLRGLQEYPEVLAEIQQAWAVPLDAATAIETLLFRRGSEDERFDLPAYEELLFLYWLARERHQGEGSEAQQVDVLLPVDEAQAPAVSVIQPAVASAPQAAAGDPVDLDLSTVPAAHDLGGEARSSRS